MNKRIVIPTIFLFGITIPFIAHAIGNTFGGKIIVAKQPGITCVGAYGPITITASIGPKGPYAIKYGSSRNVSNGKWILGRYNTIKDTSTCHQDDKNETPYPVYIVAPGFGISR